MSTDTESARLGDVSEKHTPPPDGTRETLVEAIARLRAERLGPLKIAQRLGVPVQAVQQLVARYDRTAPGQRLVHIADLTLDERCRSRDELPEATIAEYAGLMRDGVKFPPVVVYSAPGEFTGSALYLSDGWLRVAAACDAELTAILADVRVGDVRAAILHAVSANAAHGLRRTNADKRRCVLLMLEDPVWCQRSNRWVADACGVDGKTVASVRNQLRNLRSCDPDTNWCQEDEPRLGRDGKRRRNRQTDISPTSSYTTTLLDHAKDADGEVVNPPVPPELKPPTVKATGRVHPNLLPWNVDRASFELRQQLRDLKRQWPRGFRDVLVEHLRKAADELVTI